MKRLLAVKWDDWQGLTDLAFWRVQSLSMGFCLRPLGSVCDE
jgi:hypothetical protein